LAAILKYPWHREPNGFRSEKWGAYRSESENFIEARKLACADQPTFESIIMDAADELAYGIHDIEDFHRCNLIPWSLILADTAEGNAYRQRLLDRAMKRWERKPPSAGQHLSTALQEVRKTAKSASQLLQERYVGTKAQRARLRSLISGLINDQISTYELSLDGGKPGLYVPEKTKAELLIWKQITRNHYEEDPAIVAQQLGYRRIAKELWEDMVEDLDDPSSASLFPGRFSFLHQAATEKAISKARAVADCISGLTEDEMLQFHKRLRGLDSGSVFNPIAR
jgi:dGTPase